MVKEIFYEFEIGFIPIDLILIFPMKPLKLTSVTSYDEKTAENYRKCYVAEKHIVSKLSKISVPNFDTTNYKFE